MIRAAAETFKLIDGGELTGEPIAFGRDGVAVKKPDGSFSAKVAWTNFTQEALQQLPSGRTARYVQGDRPLAKAVIRVERTSLRVGRSW